jgi:hypothetical protein
MGCPLGRLPYIGVGFLFGDLAGCSDKAPCVPENMGILPTNTGAQRAKPLAVMLRYLRYWL